jgi:hypothetical protein
MMKEKPNHPAGGNARAGDSVCNRTLVARRASAGALGVSAAWMAATK